MWRDENSAGCFDGAPPFDAAVPAIPEYLTRHYAWAYLTPQAVRRFDRDWLINLIVFGNYARLSAAVLERLNGTGARRVLQVACAYGDFSLKLARQTAQAGGRLDIVDVAPIQLETLRAKLAPASGVALHRMDSAALGFEDGAFDAVVMFLLLHEQPDSWRVRTLAEAFRVTRPGGQVILVDYAKPAWWHPARYLLAPVLALLEPFALDLWRRPLHAYAPKPRARSGFARSTAFGGLYQIVSFDR